MAKAPQLVQPRLLTTSQAAAYLGICQRTLWSLSKAGSIPRVQVTHGPRSCPRYDRHDLDAWIDRQREVSHASS